MLLQERRLPGSAFGRGLYGSCMCLPFRRNASLGERCARALRFQSSECLAPPGKTASEARCVVVLHPRQSNLRRRCKQRKNSRLVIAAAGSQSRRENPRPCLERHESSASGGGGINI